MRLRRALGEALHRPSGSLTVVAPPEPVACRCCAGQALLDQVVDFNTRRVPAPPCGAPVYYRRCQSCGFVFTEAFDSWPPYEFQRHVYNEDFFAADPGFVLNRPARRAAELTALFPARGALSILDYGGLNYATVEALKEAGFARVARLDLLDSGQPPVEDRFDIVSCCDVMERVPDPREILREIIGFIADGGVAVCAASMRQPGHAAALAPRQGEVSLFTPQSIRALWQGLGFESAMMADGWHIAFRRLPDFARHLAQR